MTASNQSVTLPPPDEVLFTVRNSDDLIDAFRKVKDMLSMTNAQCDDLANLTGGHTDKLLGPTQSKSIGALTFNAFCWMFAVQFEMKIDLAQARQMQEHWEDRKRRRPAEYSENGRVSKKLLEKAKPLVLKEMGSAGGLATASKHTAALRSEIARKAGRARAAKLTSEERSAMMKKGWESRRNGGAKDAIRCSPVSSKPM